jgi:hypothetical protein
MPEHTVEQLPQWFLSMFSSTQALPQSDVPPKHCKPHVPTLFTGEQNWPLGHGVLQPPQFCGSCCVSTHVVAPESPTPHEDQPDWHVATHLLPWHTWPPGQGLPHAPQLSSFCVTSTQSPLQFVRPAWQVSAHEPWLQTFPDGHFLPQPPQLFTSTPWSMQSLPQWVVPVAQTVEHAPCEHTRSAAQAFPHAPQFCAFDCVSTHVSPHFTADPGPHGPMGAASPLSMPASPLSPLFAQLDATSRRPKPIATIADFAKPIPPPPSSSSMTEGGGVRQMPRLRSR